MKPLTSPEERAALKRLLADPDFAKLPYGTLANAVPRLLSDLEAAEQKQRWRPISEGDEPRGHVLVWAEGWPVGSEAAYHQDYKGWWLAGSHPTDAYDGQCFPTHFMPLPEAPQ